jgi:hypothetical protein
MLMSFSRNESRTGLFQPLIDPPGSIRLLLGDARGARIHQLERLLNRSADRAGGRGRNAVALLEGIVNGLGEIGVRHGRGS